MLLPFLILLCVLATAVVSGVFGLAGGMILMACLVSLLPVAGAIVLHATAQLASNGSRAFFHRRHIVWRPLRFYAAGMAGATAIMAWLAPVPDKATVFLMLGALPFLQLALARKINLDIERPPQSALCGFVSTLLHLAGGVSGMLLDVFFQRVQMTRHQIIATKAATQTLSHILRLCYFSVMAAKAHEQATLSPWLAGGVVAAALAGSALSTRLLDRLSDHHFRRATQAILLVLGAVFLVRGGLLLAGY